MNAIPYDPALTVFTKPWKALPLEVLADRVASWGFDGVELPVRPGFQVDPGSALDALPGAQQIFKERGLSIHTVAADLDAWAVQACAAAQVPMLRVMLRVTADLGYRRSVEDFQHRVHQLSPLLREGGVVVGLQNHAGNFVGSAVGLMEALAPLDPACAQAVLDLGHTGLAGEPEAIAIDLAAPRLALVNLKNAVYSLDEESPDGVTSWKRQWTSARSGITSWADGVAALQALPHQVPICLTAEYHDSQGNPLNGDPVIPRIQEDLAYLKSLLPAAPTGLQS